RKGPRVGRARKVREEAGKTKRSFSGFEAEPGKTPHQSWFGRHRAFANEAFHANLAAGEGSAATGTRRRSHPGRDLGGSVAPWRFGNGSRGAFPWHGERVSGREAPLSFVRRRSAPELYRGTGMPRRSPCVRS